MGHTVLVDAQFGVVKILRPYTGFEADNQGQSVLLFPIALTERGLPLDPLAGKPGYAPNLLRGLAVPLGARIVLWLPAIIGGSTLLGQYAYRYAIAWRLRSTFDYRQIRGAYHYPKQGKGVPDTAAPPGQQDRVVKPAAWQTIAYTQPEPNPTTTGLGTTFDRAVATVHAEDLAIRGGTLLSPHIPGGLLGAAQQGVLDPGNAKFGRAAVAPVYNVHEVQAMGDEFMLFVYRDQVSSKGTTDLNWDFTQPSGIDQNLSIFYGSGSGSVFPDVGVYVMAGAAT